MHNYIKLYATISLEKR